MNINAPSWLKTGVGTCLACLVAGCVSTGINVTSKTEGVGGSIDQRLLVVSQLAAVDETWAAAFEKAMRSELLKKGGAFVIQSRTPLALQSDKTRYASQLAAFNPDLVLVVEPGEGSVDNRGRSIKRKFEAGIFRHYEVRGRRELAWRGTVALEPVGPCITDKDMVALARDLVVRLTNDGMLPSPKPKHATSSVPVPVKVQETRPSTRGFGR